MIITFYNFSKKSNSTAVPNGRGIEKNVILKDGNSIYTPFFELSDANFDLSYNYVKWSNRYYYIQDVTIYRNNVYQIQCEIDYLRSYREQIFDTRAFVTFSTSDFNTQIADARLSQKAVASVQTNARKLFTDADTNGTYIINYVTDTATHGATGLLWTNQTGTNLLSRKLTDTEFFNIENFEKQFGNVYQCLLSCKYVPFNWLSRGTGSAQFRLGSFNTLVGGVKVRPTISYQTSIAIPFQFRDFRNTSQFTSFLLYLSGYGFLPLNADDLIGRSSLTIKCNIDGVTGEATYIVDNLAKCSCNMSTSMSIGTVAGNQLGVLTGATQAVTGALTNDAVGMLGGAFNAMTASMNRAVGNVGTQGGISAILSSIGDWTNVYLISIAHDTNINPADIAQTNGRPLNAVRRIGDLNGYCQTVDFSIATINNNVNQNINNLMNGGVFIE